MLDVVGDAVEHAFRAGVLVRWQQAGEVDPAKYLAVCGRDARNAIGVPDICVDFSVDVLELIEFLDGPSMIGNFYAAHFAEGDRVKEAQGRAALALDEVSTVLRETSAPRNRS